MKKYIILLISTIMVLCSGCAVQKKEDTTKAETEKEQISAEEIVEEEIEEKPEIIITTRDEVKEYTKSKTAEYESLFKNAGVDHFVTPNNCFVVGTETSHTILESKYAIKELTISEYNIHTNTINNAVLIDYEIHKEVGLETDSPHVQLIYQFYVNAELNPMSYEEFVDNVNLIIAEDPKAQSFNSDKYRLSIERPTAVNSSLPLTLHYVSYEAIPCSLPEAEELPYVEFESMDARESHMDAAQQFFYNSDRKVEVFVLPYADQSTDPRMDNSLGILSELTCWPDLTDDAQVLAPYHDFLVQFIDMISSGVIIDNGVTSEDLANEIISLSQINRYSQENSLYMDYDPEYGDYHSNQLQEVYKINPLRGWTQYECLSFSINHVTRDHLSVIFYVPAKVEGIKNK